MAGVDALCSGKGQWAIGVELGRDVFFFDVHFEDLVDEEGFFAIQEAFKESFHFGGVMRSRNDSAQSLLQTQEGASDEVVPCVLDPRIECWRLARALRVDCILYQLDFHILSRGGKTKRSRLLCQYGCRVGAGGA